jgi:hypothetical protein
MEELNIWRDALDELSMEQPNALAALAQLPRLRDENTTLRAENARLREQIDAANGDRVTLANVLLADSFHQEIDDLRARLEELEAVKVAAAEFYAIWDQGDDGFMGSIPIADELREALRAAGEESI